jgi:hypothetical protein
VGLVSHVQIQLSDDADQDKLKQLTDHLPTNPLLSK